MEAFKFSVLLSVALLFSVAFYGDKKVLAAGEPNPPGIIRLADPGLEITAKTLTAEDEKDCRKLFEQLASTDFDLRERALNQIVGKGMIVLPLADEYAKYIDPETASQARGLKERILLNYDGFLRTAPAVRAALAKEAEFPQFVEGRTLKQVLAEVGKQINLSIVFDPQVSSAAAELLPPGRGIASNVLNIYLTAAGLAGVPRGDVYLVTTPQQAEKLGRQRATFDWSDLGIARDEAERIGNALHIFFPPVNTEIHTGSEVFTVRGEEDCIPRAARLIALLKPGAPDALWPGMPDGNERLGKAPSTLRERLESPANLQLASQDPLDAMAQLKKQEHDVWLIANDGHAVREPPFPKELGGFAPMRLSLRNLSLGHVLHWLERRAKISAAEQASLILAYSIGAEPDERIQLSLSTKIPSVLSFYICGADVTFLYPRGAKPGAESDDAARTALWAVLKPQLELFPDCVPERDLLILRGRLLMQGHYATLTRALELIREWRQKKEAPKPPIWKKMLDEHLAEPLDWDGRGLSGGRLLSLLRKLGNVNILLEDAADGSAPEFKLTADEAQLLPPGRHSLKDLLDDLVKKANAEWRIEWGVIVLTGKTAAVKKLDF